MNKVMLIGRLTKDPEIRQGGQNNTTIARFSLAVARAYKQEGQQESDFINCVCFGKTAEIIEKHVTKGMKIAVEGEWRTGSFKNKNDDTVYTNDCNVTRFEFCESKKSNNNSTSGDDEFMPLPDDADMPFA